MLPVSMNDRIARGTHHHISGSFNRGIYFFGHHQFGFTPGAFPARHQLHRPKRNDSVRFDRQFHQGSVTTPSHAEGRCDVLVNRVTGISDLQKTQP
jgi:hypothetical protein